MIRFEDAALEKAYNDYLYTRDMMECDEDAGPDDLASVSLRYLKQHGKLDKADKEGAGGCTAVRINVNTGSDNEPWLLTFRNSARCVMANESPKNAASGVLEECIEGAEQDRTHAYAALRLACAGDPLEKTPGPDPDGGVLTPRQAAYDSVLGFTSCADRSEIATGIADEIYHQDFEKSRLEAAAVISAVPAVELINAGRDTEVNIQNANDAADANEINSVGMAASGVNAPDIKDIVIAAPGNWQKSCFLGEPFGFSEGMKRVAEDINTCSKRGLAGRFDSTRGAGTVMMPLGGINQLTPVQAASHKIPLERGDTDDCSVMSWASNPYIYKESPYHGAYLAVVESIAGLIAGGASFNEVYLSIMADAADDRAMAALLGAFEAEMGLSAPAVSVCRAEGADAFISYAVTMGKASELCSPEFKGAGHKVVLLEPEIEMDETSAYAGLPTPESLIAVWRKAYELIANGKAVAAYTPGIGGIAEAVMKMSYGNGIGFDFNEEYKGVNGESIAMTNEKIFGYAYGSILLEIATNEPVKSRNVKITEIGSTSENHVISRGDEFADIGELLLLYEGKLESVYPSNADSGPAETGNVNYAARSWHAPIFKRTTPKVLIPALPGATSCDVAARAVRAAGGLPEIMRLPGGSAEEILISSKQLAEAISGAQIIFLPDGINAAEMDVRGRETPNSFSDDGSNYDTSHISEDMLLDLAEMTTYVFRNEAVRESLQTFMDKKDGLIAGAGAGFKALLDLGLLPNGEIGDEDGPALLPNTLGARQSRIVRVRIASNKSPWLRDCKPGEVYSLPVSCSEGRFTATEEVLKKLAVNGQIATQYADDEGNASTDIRFNPSGSVLAIEGITSPDGRILGRMGCIERTSQGLYRNVPGTYFGNIFENAVRYFK